jgi:hypothetical protein
MSPHGTLLASFLWLERTARVRFSSCALNGLTLSSVAHLLKIEWLNEADIAERLRALREDHSAWRIPRDTGQFSLAGAQPKTVLVRERQVGGCFGPSSDDSYPRASVWRVRRPRGERTFLPGARALGLPPSIPGSCILGMKSLSSWNATIESIPNTASAECIRKIFARRSGFFQRASIRRRRARHPRHRSTVKNLFQQCGRRCSHFPGFRCLQLADRRYRRTCQKLRPADRGRRPCASRAFIRFGQRLPVFPNRHSACQAFHEAR